MWSRESVVAALRDWMQEHERQPTWNEWKRERRKPSVDVIAHYCGSWSAAMKMAGGVPRGQGEYEHHRLPRGNCARCGAPLVTLRSRFCSRQCGLLTWFDENGRPGTSRNQARYRAIAAEYLGRKLTADEAVHHIDGDRRNDDPSNLAVFPTRGDHIRFHHRGGTITALDGTRWECVAQGRCKLMVSRAEPPYGVRDGGANGEGGAAGYERSGRSLSGVRLAGARTRSR